MLDQRSPDRKLSPAQGLVFSVAVSLVFWLFIWALLLMVFA